MADEILEKRGRGRPKGTGGNKRPDSTAQLQPGDNQKYITHDLKMWDWPKVDMTKPQEVSERIKQYLQICVEDEIKPSVAGMALAFGIDRRRLWEIANGVVGTNSVTHNVAPEARDLVKKAYYLLNAQMENYMQNGKINPIAGIFLMKNNWGYTDKQEVVVTPNQLGEQLSANDLQKKYLEDVAIDADNYEREE